MKPRSLKGFDKLMDTLRGFFLVVMLLGLALWLFQGFGYRINLTSSVPVGIYQVRPSHGVLKRGQIVWFCPPNTPQFQKARDEGLIPEGDCPGNYLHWFKPVAALPGDTVVVSRQGVSVNGALLSNSQPLEHTSSGQKLSPRYGNFRVQPGTVWLVSPYDARSYDSRYLGAFSITQLQAIAIAIRRS